jgi:hypothetical protein
MAKEVTIRTRDLRLLVEQLFEAEVADRAKVSVLTSVQDKNPAAMFEFGMRVEESKPAAAQAIELRYRQLQQSLESGNDIPAALSQFLGTN